jgi:hypothetical protein
MLAMTPTDVAAFELVRSGHSFEAGKLAYLACRTAARGAELSPLDEWDAFLRWAEKFPGVVPNVLRVNCDWDGSSAADLKPIWSAWMAFRGGWLVALSNSGGEP